MTPREYYNTYIVFAKESERKTKVPALFTLAQAALESGWGAKVKGNNFFGIKDTDGVNGNEVEFLTTEYNKRTGVWIKIKQYFRKYKTAADCFTDHGAFLVNNKRYAKAFYFRDPVLFAREVAKAGYATDPNYYDKIVAIIKTLLKG
jgi:flagellum-specific peptidoglycan hydrolase FlgJ